MSLQTAPGGTATGDTTTGTTPLLHFHYEVFGKVQRVFMRKHTVLAATDFGVSGYVFNTEDGSVKGEACGTASAVQNFQLWLKTRGSPRARIDHAIFSPAVEVVADPFHGDFVKKIVLLSNGSQFANKASSKKGKKSKKRVIANRGRKKE